ncbi:MAG: glutamate synthase subunit alpha, partial [Anaerolineales bacterium]|nr:glutamate synthase subunit alpha [Anaerolineales bacterium]
MSAQQKSAHENTHPKENGAHGANRFLPAAQGLYDPAQERDACGMGFVVDIAGVPAHEIVAQALTVLHNLSHRGAAGSEKNSGDGAGILLQIPDRFFRAIWQEMGVVLPPAGQYGVAQFFLSPDQQQRQQSQQLVNDLAQAAGFALIGWRDVPTCNDSLGQTALRGEPFPCQFFLHPTEQAVAPQQLERRLFVLRRRIEKAAQDQRLYIPSFSARTIVYKGMLLAEQLPAYYPDLRDPRCESAIALVHSRFSTNTFPSWERAHPYRRVIHNGEINTLKGNENWLRAREALLESELFGEELADLLPIIDDDGSDTAKFDNLLEFLTLAGRDLPHAAMMMIPEPWSRHEGMSDELK